MTLEDQDDIELDLSDCLKTKCNLKMTGKWKKAEKGEAEWWERWPCPNALAQSFNPHPLSLWTKTRVNVTTMLYPLYIQEDEDGHE